MQVDLSQVSKSESPSECLYAITFTLISGWCQISLHSMSRIMDPRLILICIAPSGNIRRFRRICEHIQSMVCAARRAPPASPRAQRRTGKGQEMSESSSCGSDTSERITDRLGPATRQVSRVTRDILSVVTTLDVYL